MQRKMNNDCQLINRLKVLDHELSRLSEQIEIIKYGDQVLNQHLQSLVSASDENDEVMALINIEGNNPKLSQLRNYYFDDIVMLQNKLRLVTREISEIINVQEIKTNQLSTYDLQLITYYQHVDLNGISKINFNGIIIE